MVFAEENDHDTLSSTKQARSACWLEHDVSWATRVDPEGPEERNPIMSGHWLHCATDTVLVPSPTDPSTTC